jgi:hypothetical protein
MSARKWGGSHVRFFAALNGASVGGGRNSTTLVLLRPTNQGSEGDRQGRARRVGKPRGRFLGVPAGAHPIPKDDEPSVATFDRSSESTGEFS